MAPQPRLRPSPATAKTQKRSLKWRPARGGGADGASARGAGGAGPQAPIRGHGRRAGARRARQGEGNGAAGRSGRGRAAGCRPRAEAASLASPASWSPGSYRPPAPTRFRSLAGTRGRRGLKPRAGELCAEGLVPVKRGLRAPRGQADVVSLSALNNRGTQKCCRAVKTWFGSGNAYPEREERM